MRLKDLVFLLFISLLPIYCMAQEAPEKNLYRPPAPVLLPKTPEAWAINLHKQGGIMGIFDLTAAINSDGQYLCGDSDEIKSLSLIKSPFSELSEMVDKLPANIHLKPINESVAYCNDCLYNSLSFYRNSPAEKTFTNNYSNLIYSDVPTIREVFAKVWEVTKCDEKPKGREKKKGKGQI